MSWEVIRWVRYTLYTTYLISAKRTVPTVTNTVLFSIPILLRHISLTISFPKYKAASTRKREHGPGQVSSRACGSFSKISWRPQAATMCSRRSSPPLPPAIRLTAKSKRSASRRTSSVSAWASLTSASAPPIFPAADADRYLLRKNNVPVRWYLRYRTYRYRQYR